MSKRKVRHTKLIYLSLWCSGLEGKPHICVRISITLTTRVLFDRYGPSGEMRRGACYGWSRRRRSSLEDQRKHWCNVSLATMGLLRARAKARRGQTHAQRNPMLGERLHVHILEKKTDLITQYEYRLGLCNCTFVIKLSTVIQTSHEDICIHT